MTSEANTNQGPGPMNIATISAGFEKGDFLVREEQGNRVYFDFFEEAFNYISNKGYGRMSREEEKHWVDLMNVIHDSVKGGMKYNTGTLLMVLSRPITDVPDKKEISYKAKAHKDMMKTMNP